MKLAAVVLADASPLNVLIRLNYTDVLTAMFDSVVVPPLVIQELTHASTPPAVRAFVRSPPEWVRIRTPTRLLPLGALDAGERAAISLAVELGALLMIDEIAGREHAVRLGLAMIGVIGILERAANAGLIEDLAAAHSALRAISFHASEKLFADSLARHSTRRS